MAELTTDYMFDGSIEQVFTGIRQYAEYSKYLSGVTATEVLPPVLAGSVCRVRYDLKIIKTFHYTLHMFEESPKRIWWSLEESNIMKQSNGSWTFSDAGGGRTKAIYTLDIAFKGLVPSAIVDQITKANLPGMLKGMQKLIDDQQRLA